MNGRKVAVLVTALIAVCAIIYLVLPPFQTPPLAPKTEASKPAKQLRKTTAKMPKPAKSRLPKQQGTYIPQDNQTTSDVVQPREIMRPVSRSEPATSDENTSTTAPDQKTQELEKRMQEFKEKYQWDEPATMNMAEHLIGLIPKPFRDSGITAMIKNLDEAQQQGTASTVDELMVLQSVEKIMPEEFKPQLQEIIEKYKADQPSDRR